MWIKSCENERNAQRKALTVKGDVVPKLQAAETRWNFADHVPNKLAARKLVKWVGKEGKRHKQSVQIGNAADALRKRSELVVVQGPF